MDLIGLLAKRTTAPETRDAAIGALRHIAEHSTKPEARREAQEALDGLGGGFVSSGGVGDRVLIEVQRAPIASNGMRKKRIDQ